MGESMVLVLVLLLMDHSLADQVCINISNHSLTIALTNLSIVEEGIHPTKCQTDGVPCLFRCRPSNETWFNGSFACLDYSVVNDESPIPLFVIAKYTHCDQVVCSNTSIVPLLNTLNCPDCLEKEVITLQYVRSSCQDLFRTSQEVKKTFIGVEQALIHKMMAASQLEEGFPLTYNLKTLSVNVYTFSRAGPELTEDMVQIQAPQLLPDNESSIPEIWLPVNALNHIKEQKTTIAVVSYMQDSQFQFHQEKISTMALRIEVLEQCLQNLQPPIKMIFPITQTQLNNSLRLLCHYFDQNDWKWKPDGCQTQVEQSNITCSCDHATPFAVLLIREPIAKVHWEILSYISYIGCGLSAFFSALSLVTFLFSRNNKLDYSITIHVSLSGALFLLNSTFLLTEWGARVSLGWVCECVAAFMHYSLLCCFTWMAIEALHLYLLLIRVFNTYYKHYLLKLSLAGWGIPGVIVATSLGVKDFKQFYGVTQLIMSDTNTTNEICWITDDSFFYSLNLVYFTLIFVFNFGILMAVASSFCKMKQAIKSNSMLRAKAKGKLMGVPQRFSASCKSGLTLLGLTCLMGTSWGLAFLGSGYVNYPILYLFCILNSLQGFFIFLWICLSAKKQKKRQMEEKLSSSPVRTSDVKSE
ncbi:adhesion G protein-coupled receptor G3 [Nothobranchius furzeri]|uniref:adhesion G protein-coupled receptor G3 n=1 Tax=Nothobranchius furzeri TaxID=105023 RepID=UPI003904A1DE